MGCRLENGVQRDVSRLPGRLPNQGVRVPTGGLECKLRASGLPVLLGSGHFGILGRKFIVTSGVHVTSVPDGPSTVLTGEGKGRSD